MYPSSAQFPPDHARYSPPREFKPQQPHQSPPPFRALPWQPPEPPQPAHREHPSQPPPQVFDYSDMEDDEDEEEDSKESEESEEESDGSEPVELPKSRPRPVPMFAVAGPRAAPASSAPSSSPYSSSSAAMTPFPAHMLGGGASAAPNALNPNPKSNPQTKSHAPLFTGAIPPPHTVPPLASFAPAPTPATHPPPPLSLPAALPFIGPPRTPPPTSSSAAYAAPINPNPNPHPIPNSNPSPNPNPNAFTNALTTAHSSKGIPTPAQHPMPSNMYDYSDMEDEDEVTPRVPVFHVPEQRMMNALNGKVRQDKDVPVGGSNQDYLGLAQVYRQQRPYSDHNFKATCLLCHERPSQDVFFPCEHRCVCRRCITSEKFCEDRQLQATPGGYCICPLCATAIKRILPHERGSEVDKYWQWVEEISPELPPGFARNFKLSAGALESVYVKGQLSSEVGGMCAPS